MNEFNPAVFLRHMTIINRRPLIAETPDGPEFETVIHAARQVAGMLERLEMKPAAAIGRRLADMLEREDGPTRSSDTFETMADALALAAGFEDTPLFHVPGNRASYLNKEPLEMIGQQAADLFKDKAIDELDNALRCYAFGMYTACGMHLMRACEPAVQKFANAIGHSKPLENWGSLFDTWRRMTPTQKTPFMDIFEPFQAFKDSARNKLAHGKITCRQKDAERMLLNVPVFIERAAALA